MSKCQYCNNYDEETDYCEMQNHAFLRGGRGCDDYEEYDEDDHLDNPWDDQDEPWYEG